MSTLKVDTLDTRTGSGNITVSRPLSGLSGSGASLTALNATELTSGTIPDARLPATLPAKSGVNLTALNATNLGSGTVPDARFPATLPAASGVNLTALNATQLTSGTLPMARLSGTLPALNGSALTNLAGVGVGRNAIINGNFDVWQRGTSFAGVTAVGYQADRWVVSPASGCTMTISRQAFTAGQTDVPYEPSYFLRADITTAGSANAEIGQRIEDVRTFAGQVIRVTFWAKSSAGTPTLTCRTLQNFGSGGSSVVVSGGTTATLSSSWQKVTYSITLGSMSGKTIGAGSYLEFNFYWANNSTSNDVDLAQVKVERGSIATDFEPKSYGEELKLCQRYYYERWQIMKAYSSNGVTGWEHPVTMRAVPSFAWEYPENGTASRVYRIENGAQNTLTSSNTQIIYDTGLNHWYNQNGSFANWAGTAVNTYITMDAEL